METLSKKTTILFSPRLHDRLSRPRRNCTTSGRVAKDLRPRNAHNGFCLLADFGPTLVCRYSRIGQRWRPWKIAINSSRPRARR